MIVIVKVSVRNYMAIEVANVNAWRSTATPKPDTKDGNRVGYEYADGKVICGPANWTTVDNAAYQHAKAKNQTLTYEEYKKKYCVQS